MFADLVFRAGTRGGRVFLADAARSTAHAVAVTNGRISAVGHDVSALVGPHTQVVDLDGGLLVPGFQDAHVHPVWGGLDMLRCDLAELSTREEYLSRIAEYAQEHPDDEWILGGGWQMSAFPGGVPTAEDLDSVVPDRPAFLPNRDGHGAWVNSRALELAGITRETADPPDGRIERDASGAPSGTLHEGAMGLVNRLLPTEAPERLVEALLQGQRHLHSYGVTAWQDAIVGTEYGDAGDPLPAYLTAAASGALTGRVVGSLWWDRSRGLEQIDDIVRRRDDSTVGRFRARSVKIMQDGVAENFTAAMLEPYCDGHGHPREDSGISFVEPELIKEAATRLDALGFTLHFHAIGDRAVRECLDAVEAALVRNGPRGNTHHISHIQVVHPDDIPRFRALDVTANMQMLWATLEPQMVDLTIPFLGEQRSAWQYPFGDLLRSGAALAAGSDWSVSTPNPMAAIHVAVNRRSAPTEWEGDYPAFLPEQAIDLATALVAYTAGSARVNHLDDTGTIAVGMRADLALLDRDPFEHPVEEIGLTEVRGTWVEGERVYDSAE
ncbi:N-substituted formamide deformylase precursor [Microbacterium oxydans]|uniref:N-substituted formamide deformylase n=1 Tax=Microbacterium oxydans TaxID=82380 RepID=A0A0F0KRD4_9MICO|nr:amidohydrolase [Microbacterium oxydans]KJL23433.1 N-substituted formamide deformylase precursor [Microbacterium oxydans]